MAFKLTHPDSANQIEVETAQVPLYLAQGWLTKPSAPTPETPEQAPVVTVLAEEPAPAKPKKK